MAKSKKNIDQKTFDFESAIDRYLDARDEVLDAATADPRQPDTENAEEICIELAGSIKTALRRSGLSREELCERINEYYGADSDGQYRRGRITIHMLNHHLSKPVEYPLPAYLLPALVSILDDLEPLQILAGTKGRVICAEEVKLMQLGRLEKTIDELQRLRREIRRGR